MNKRTAQKIARNGIKHGQVKQMLERARVAGAGNQKASVVNSQFTKAQALDMYIRATRGQDDDSVIKGSYCIVATNAIREFGDYWGGPELTKQQLAWARREQHISQLEQSIDKVKRAMIEAGICSPDALFTAHQDTLTFLEGYFTAFTGTRTLHPLPGVTLNCISLEAKELLETVLLEWDKHKQNLPEKQQDKVYPFAYWLIRWSGLVAPTRKDNYDYHTSKS